MCRVGSVSSSRRVRLRGCVVGFRRVAFPVPPPPSPARPPVPGVLPPALAGGGLGKTHRFPRVASLSPCHRAPPPPPAPRLGVLDVPALPDADGGKRKKGKRGGRWWCLWRSGVCQRVSRRSLTGASVRARTGAGPLRRGFWPPPVLAARSAPISLPPAPPAPRRPPFPLSLSLSRFFLLPAGPGFARAPTWLILPVAYACLKD